ncbi:YhcN/YlaJ family sporulation lipoprotein [Paenibacillus sp. A14]
MFLLTSCAIGSRNASPSPQDQTQTNQVRMQGGNEVGNGVRKNNVNGTMSQQDRQVHLEELVKRIPGVRDAHCVIMGNTAIVGIDVDAKLERARVGSIKYAAAEALRKDPNGAGAIVTADIDLNQRITEIGNKISNGQPLAGFATELADIIGRIVPQMPGDTRPREGQNPGDTGNPGDRTNQNVPGNNRTAPQTGTQRQMNMAPGR